MGYKNLCKSCAYVRRILLYMNSLLITCDQLVAMHVHVVWLTSAATYISVKSKVYQTTIIDQCSSTESEATDWQLCFLMSIYARKTTMVTFNVQ